jgi:hypothetical protein
LSEAPFHFPNPPTLDLSVVVVSFNTRDLVLACLDSVKSRSRGFSYEIFVTDNASADASADAVAQHFPDARLIRNDANRGFSAANNQAIRQAHGRYVVLLNSDTVLVEDCFAPIIAYLDRHPEYGIATPQVIDRNDRVCSMRLWEDTPADAVRRILGRYDVAGEAQKMGSIEIKEVTAIGGSCFIVRRSLFEAIGLLDEHYFLYNEEDDFCRRARKHGHKVCYFPSATVKHLHGQSTHQEDIRETVIVETYKSNLYFYAKHYPPLWNWVLRALYKTVFLAGIGKDLLKIFSGLPSATADESIRLKLKLLFMRVPRP